MAVLPLRTLLSVVCLAAGPVMVSCAQGNPRIGIVGAGIGGTAAAHFLRDHFGDSADIDIYEKGLVGGRLRTLTVGDHAYNIGGDFLHPENIYMKNFTEMLGLGKVDKTRDGNLGIFDGKEVVFSSSDWLAVTLGQLVWRYGLDVYNMANWAKEKVINNMHRFYELQRRGHAFTTVEGLMSAINPEFLDWAKKPFDTLLREEGFSDLFIEEFVMAAIRAIYGQTTEVHGLAGGASMVAFQPGIWNIRGGNQKVPEGLLKTSGARLIRAEVKVVTLKKDDPPLYQIDYTSGGAEQSKEYDIVVMATPIYKDVTNIQFKGFSKEIEPVDNDFHLQVINLIEGIPNASKFGVSNPQDLPNNMLTTNDSKLVDVLKKLKHVEGSYPDKDTFVLSTTRLPEDAELRDLFPERTDFQQVAWQAYPAYPSATELPTFTLHSQLYHVNAIEMAASCMEMSSTAAKNVALLAYQRWSGKTDNIDRVASPGPADSNKSEL